jgi:hypothetical protein
MSESIVAGNVGIGTNAPTYTLDVNGSARVSSNVYVNGDIYVLPYSVGYTPSSGTLSFTLPTLPSGYTGAWAIHFGIYCGGYIGADVIYGIIYPRRAIGIILWTLGNGAGTSWNGQATVTSVSNNIVTLSVPGYGSGMWGSALIKILS